MYSDLSSFILRPTSLAVFMTKESKHCASSMMSERKAMSSAKSVSMIYVAGNLRINLCYYEAKIFSVFGRGLHHIIDDDDE